MTFVELWQLSFLDVLLNIDNALSRLVWLNLTFRVPNRDEQVSVARISDPDQVGHPIQRLVVLHDMVLHVLLKILSDFGGVATRCLIDRTHAETDARCLVVAHVRIHIISGLEELGAALLELEALLPALAKLDLLRLKLGHLQAAKHVEFDLWQVFLLLGRRYFARQTVQSCPLTTIGLDVPAVGLVNQRRTRLHYSHHTSSFAVDL